MERYYLETEREREREWRKKQGCIPGVSLIFHKEDIDPRIPQISRYFARNLMPIRRARDIDAR